MKAQLTMSENNSTHLRLQLIAEELGRIIMALVDRGSNNFIVHRYLNKDENYLKKLTSVSKDDDVNYDKLRPTLTTEVNQRTMWLAYYFYILKDTLEKRFDQPNSQYNKQDVINELGGSNVLETLCHTSITRYFDQKTEQLYEKFTWEIDLGPPPEATTKMTEDITFQNEASQQSQTPITNHSVPHSPSPVGIKSTPQKSSTSSPNVDWVKVAVAFVVGSILLTPIGGAIIAFCVYQYEMNKIPEQSVSNNPNSLFG